MRPSTPPEDALGHTARLDEAVRVVVLGLPCLFRSNSPALIESAGRCFEVQPASAGATPSKLLIDIVVHGSPDTDHRPLQLIHRAYGGHYMAASGMTLLSAQTDNGYGLAFVPPSLVADEANLHYNVLELLALLLASYHDRTPVHAAALTNGTNAVVLAGNSGAGKSTLVYAAVQTEMRLVAEDVVYVSLDGPPQIWGHPRRLHLLPDAPALFPELADIVPHVQANGKRKLAVELRPDQLTTHARPSALCILERAPGRSSRLLPITAEEAIRILSAHIEPGFDLLAGRIPQALAALATPGAYRLQVNDPHAALGLIAKLLEQT